MTKSRKRRRNTPSAAKSKAPPPYYFENGVWVQKEFPSIQDSLDRLSDNIEDLIHMQNPRASDGWKVARGGGGEIVYGGHTKAQDQIGIGIFPDGKPYIKLPSRWFRLRRWLKSLRSRFINRI